MDEQQYREYLDGDSDLSALYRQGDSPQPSAGADATILAAAREKTGSSTRDLLGRLTTRLAVPAWPLPWVTAATTAGLIALAATALLESGSPDTTDPVASGMPAPIPAPATGASVTTSATAAAPAPTPPAADTVKTANEPGPIPSPPPDTPGSRLAEMERLLQEGRQDEARVLFYLFRERYPSHPVPEDLLTRLGM